MYCLPLNICPEAVSTMRLDVRKVHYTRWSCLARSSSSPNPASGSLHAQATT